MSHIYKWNPTSKGYKCSGCGKEVELTSLFCPNCGGRTVDHDPKEAKETALRTARSEGLQWGNCFFHERDDCYDIVVIDDDANLMMEIELAPDMSLIQYEKYKLTLNGGGLNRK